MTPFSDTLRMKWPHTAMDLLWMVVTGFEGTELSKNLSLLSKREQGIVMGAILGEVRTGEAGTCAFP